MMFVESSLLLKAPLRLYLIFNSFSTVEKMRCGFRELKGESRLRLGLPGY